MLEAGAETMLGKGRQVSRGDPTGQASEELLK